MLEQTFVVKNDEKLYYSTSITPYFDPMASENLAH
jgi:hypothetical protein